MCRSEGWEIFLFTKQALSCPQWNWGHQTVAKRRESTRVLGTLEFQSWPAACTATADFSLEKSQPSCQKVYLDKLMPPVELGARRRLQFRWEPRDFDVSLGGGHGRFARTGQNHLFDERLRLIFRYRRSFSKRGRKDHPRCSRARNGWASRNPSPWQTGRDSSVQRFPDTAGFPW